MMDKDKIQQQIESFYGSLTIAFEFVKDINDDLNIDFGTMLDSDNSEKFVTFVRNLMSRSIIERPMKSGRSLILTGQNVLQILVARKYLGRGVAMNALKGQIADKPTGELYEKLFAKTLDDVIEITSTYSSSLMPEHYNDNEEEQSDSNLFHLIEINDNMKLLIKEGSYMTDKISTITKYLKRQKRS